METEMRVVPIDPFARNLCLVCAMHRNFHLATTDHSFVPGDSWTVEVPANELKPGDTIAKLTVPRQRASSTEVPKFWVYRRR